MHCQEGVDRSQIFMTSLEELVPGDSWARLVDLFVDSMPINELGFANLELNKEDERAIPAGWDESPVDFQARELR